MYVKPGADGHAMLQLPLEGADALISPRLFIATGMALSLTLAPLAPASAANGAANGAAKGSLVRICTGGGDILIALFGEKSGKPGHGRSAACHSVCLTDRLKLTKQNRPRPG